MKAGNKATEKKDTGAYGCVKVCIPLSCPAGEYLEELAVSVTDLKNRVSFLKRQVFTGAVKEVPARNEQEVLDGIRQALPEMNKISVKALEKKIANARKKNDMGKLRKLEKAKPVEYHMPSGNSRVLSYAFLDAFLKVTEDSRYTRLPAHVAQNAIQEVCEQWDSFFGLLQAFREGNIPAAPGLPGYVRKGTPSTVTFSNTQAKIIHRNPDGKKVTKKNPEQEGASAYIQFRDGIDYPIGKLEGSIQGFREVVCRVQEGRVQVCFVMEKTAGTVLGDNGKYAGIDPGIDNLFALVMNTGDAPLLFDGKWLKSLNRYVNKKSAELVSLLAKRTDKAKTTKRIRRLWQKRADIIRQYYQRMNNMIVSFLLEHGIHTVVAGKNTGWKQETRMGAVNNQKFAMIPHAKMLADLKYKCLLNGIRYLETEESYTSKASLAEGDTIPVFQKGHTGKYRFSGRRVHRGLYRTKDGMLLNADVNAAGNIIRKAFPDAFRGFDIKKLLNPKRIRVTAA